MRINRISKLLAMLLLLAAIGVGCSSESTKNVSEKNSEKADLQDANPAIKAYLALKDDLVKSDANKAKLSAKEFYVAIEKLEGKEVEQMKEEAQMIVEHADVSVQRAHFQVLSDLLYAYAQMTDMGVPLYRQYCPMAFENKGAHWLSSESEIMNPYFGDKMLHCGVVKDEF